MPVSFHSVAQESQRPAANRQRRALHEFRKHQSASGSQWPDSQWNLDHLRLHADFSRDRAHDLRPGRVAGRHDAVGGVVDRAPIARSTRGLHQRGTDHLHHVLCEPDAFFQSQYGTAGAVYCLWNATQSGRLLWWLALGMCWGIGMLSKYQMVVTIICNLAYLWTQRSVNTAALLRGSLLASVIGAALFVPHLLWVFTHDSPTIHYAMNYVGAEHSLTDKAARMLSFNADQLLRLLPALLLLLLVRRFRKSPGEPAASGNHDERSQVKRFLAIHAWGPLIIMNLLCLLTGLGLGMHWGTAFLWLLPLWYLTTASGQGVVTANPSTFLLNAAVVQAIMVIALILTI